MAIVIMDEGAGNLFEIAPGVMENSVAKIIIKGDGNFIKIDQGCVLESACIVIGSNCVIYLGADSKLRSIDIYCASDCQIDIGRKVSCTWRSRVYAHEPSNISIGDRCLIANNVSIMSSDMHSIVDLETGVRINPAEDIVIGEHVWLASSVKVMKGVKIGNDTVIGAGSVVTKDIPKNCVAAGAPAVVVRSHTNWNIEILR